MVLANLKHMHSLRCMHAQVSQLEAAQKHTHTHTHTHTQTHTHGAIDMVWCCFLHTSYTHHTHIIHTPYTHHTQHMHASRCMYAQVSQPEAALKHTHTHTESNRHGVVLYQTHIIHNICIHRVACTHRSASLRQLRNTHTHTYTHRESNRQGVVLYHTHLIHTSYTHHTQHTGPQRRKLQLFEDSTTALTTPHRMKSSTSSPEALMAAGSVHLRPSIHSIVST